jgi:hypothetical protein
MTNKTVNVQSCENSFSHLVYCIVDNLEISLPCYCTRKKALTEQLAGPNYLPIKYTNIKTLKLIQTMRLAL